MEQSTLLPEYSWGSIKYALSENLIASKTVKGCVAYWTIFPENLPALIDSLRREGSFYVVDLRLPTNVDALAAFVREGANIYIFHPYLKTRLQEGPKGLLHAKMILMDFEQNFAELWVGSHNMTKRALFGINLEASLKVNTSSDSPLYRNSLFQLEALKSSPDVEKFDLDKVDYYKMLQGKDELEEDEMEVYVIKIAGEHIANLPDERMFQILSSNNRDINKIRSAIGESKVIIQATDISERKEYLFWATIPQSGALDKEIDKSTGITFSPRRLARRIEKVIPILQPSTEIDPHILRQFGFFVNIEIISGPLSPTSKISQKKPTPVHSYNDATLEELKSRFPGLTMKALHTDKIIRENSGKESLIPEIIVKRLREFDDEYQSDFADLTGMSLVDSVNIFREMFDNEQEFIEKVDVSKLIKSHNLSPELRWHPLTQKMILKDPELGFLDE